VSRPRFARRLRGRRALTLAFAPRLIIQLSGGCQISPSTKRAPPRVQSLLMSIVLLHIETVQKPLSSSWIFGQPSGGAVTIVEAKAGSPHYL
jgi:hypothetical protein